MGAYRNCLPGTRGPDPPQFPPSHPATCGIIILSKTPEFSVPEAPPCVCSSLFPQPAWQSVCHLPWAPQQCCGGLCPTCIAGGQAVCSCVCPTPPEDPCSSGRRGPEGISEVVQWSENPGGLVHEPGGCADPGGATAEEASGRGVGLCGNHGRIARVQTPWQVGCWASICRS